MIYRRLGARLKAQDWLAITIEVIIVIVGVFIGTMVANANQQRLEGIETEHRLRQLQPELHKIMVRTANVREYYAITRRYAQAAFAGWADDPRISDSDFVITAYQASQVKAMATTSQSWAELIGADRLRNIDEPDIRDPMLRLITYPAENLGLMRMQTKYRDDVRTIIPDDVQEKIRNQCGDYLATPKSLDLALRQTCTLTIEPVEAARVAADLRRHPEMIGELRLHLALASSLLNDINIYDMAARRLSEQLERRNGGRR